MHIKAQEPMSILAEYDGFRWLARSSWDESKAFHGRTLGEALGKLIIWHKEALKLDIKAYGLGGMRYIPSAVPATPAEEAYMRENIKAGRHKGNIRTERQEGIS